MYKKLTDGNAKIFRSGWFPIRLQKCVVSLDWLLMKALIIRNSLDMVISGTRLL